jgi:hypothetical protein
MVLIAVAADKGSPGVTTASLAVAAVWPRPVLLAECDAAGGDLFYRLPAADGGRLDPQRGLLSLAVAARRGIQPHQVWRHTQKLYGGLDILTGLINAEQSAGLHLLWGQVGKVLAEIPDVDVIADCGRLGADGPFYDLLAHASAVVLITRVTLEDMVRLRDRVIAVARGLANRRLLTAPIGVVVVAGHNHFKRSVAEAGQALAESGAPGRILGGLADDAKSAQMLRGQWSTRLDRSPLIRTARELAAHLAVDVPTQMPKGIDAAPPGASTAAGGSGPSGPGVSPGSTVPPRASTAHPSAPRAPEPAEARPPTHAAEAHIRGFAARPPAANPPPPEPTPPDPAVRAPARFLAQDPVPVPVLQPVPGPVASPASNGASLPGADRREIRGAQHAGVGAGE